ncbi:MAG: TIGR02594 family protein [Hyphomicrobiaceae bacterium]
MPEPPWMPLAWSDLGQREVPGVAANARITAYFRDAGHPEIDNDETAWCAAFVGATLERAGHRCSRSLMARSYLKWGIEAEQPAPGAIAVLSRGSDPALGHVGFLVALTATKVILLGGNQSNAVTVEAFDRRRLLALRNPKTATASSTAPATITGIDAGFAPALKLILAHEGGWSDDPFDPGGATNKGITLAVYARELRRDITADSIAELKAELRRIPDTLVHRIYLERYWRPAHSPELPPALALFHFDTAVNMGVGTAARLLQDALDVTIDGEIGPETLAAVRAANLPALLARYADLRRRRYRALSHFWRFGRGWLARVDTTLAAANAFAAPTPPRHQTAKDTTTMPTDNDAPQLPATPTKSATSTTPPAGKWWGESLTIWGTLLTAVTTVAPAILATIGIDLPASLLQQLGTDAITAFQAIVGFIGTVMTIAGRIRATQPLGTRRLTIRL